MVLKYSIAFDLTGKGRSPRPPGTAELWTATVDLLHETLRIADRLPDPSRMKVLLDQDQADLEGRDLDLRWAHETEADQQPTWAVTIEHPGQDERLLWGLDLSARSTPAGPRIGIRLRMEALGQLRQPMVVETRRPGIVTALMRTYRTASNGLDLRDRFLPVQAMPRLRKLLTDPDRHLPILLLGPAAARVDDEGIAKVLAHLAPLRRQAAGAAVLAMVPDRRSLARFNRGIDTSLQLPAENQFAIYWPLERGMRRDEIEQRCRETFPVPGPDAVEAATARVAARLAECLVIEDPGRIATVDTLRARRAVRDGARRRGATQDLEKPRKDYDDLLDEHEKVERELRAAQHDRKSFERELRGLKTMLFTRPDTEQPSGGEPPRDWLDWDVPDMGTALAICLASPQLRGRVVFTDAAREGSKSEFQEPNRALAAIQFLGSTFLDHVRQGVTEDLVDFAARHGFEVAMIETGITRGNEGWMRERDVQIEGRTIRCEPHLKLKVGKAKDSPRLRLSIHFAIDGRGADARLVLGHVGRHLTTSSSRNW